MRESRWVVEAPRDVVLEAQEDYRRAETVFRAPGYPMELRVPWADVQLLGAGALPSIMDRLSFAFRVYPVLGEIDVADGAQE